jgi:outer membrane protein assembly factor BamB
LIQPSRPTRLVLDGVAIGAVILAMLEIGVVAFVKGGRSSLGGPVVTLVAGLGLLVVLVGLLLGLTGRFGGAARMASRVMAYAGIVAATKLFADRWPPSVPPRPTAEVSVADSALQQLTVDQQLRWAVRVAGHAVSVAGRADSVLDVPRSWPLPPNVDIAVLDLIDSTVVSASKRGDAGRSCHFTLYRSPSPAAPRTGRHDPLRCGTSGPRSDSRRTTIRRTDWPAQVQSGKRPSGVAGWAQYRNDAARSGVTSAGVRGAGSWQVAVDGELRSTASVIGDRVLVGTHGPGALHVFEARSGRPVWMQYEPNWIHQDAVSDGQLVVVGFGDNTGSLYGESPGGVSAFALENGALQWSVFEGSSVMTSPVLWRGRAAYVTSTGTLVVRDLASGAETGRLLLPGRAPMAPPALIGDTLIASLDAEYVCAIRLETLDRLWCTRLPGAGMLGHSSPTVLGNRVYVSGGIFQDREILGISRWNWRRIRTTFGWIGPNAPGFEYDGQRIWALELATGKVAWASSLYPSRFGPAGHVSGTAIGESGAAVVVLPLAGKMVALDPQSGRELWAQDIGPTRGPAAHTADRLILSLRSGELRVVRASTGAIECSIPTATTFDRAGPAIADSTVFFGSVDGVFVAVPLVMLTSCKVDELRALLREELGTGWMDTHLRRAAQRPGV